MTSKSKKQVKEEVVRKLDAALDKLYHIWNEIGIDEGQVENRAGTVSMHLCNLLDEMVTEEQQLLDEMAVNIQRSVSELSSLCLELTLPVVKVSEQLSMVLRDKELRTQLESLNAEKQERMRKLKKLLQEDQDLCQALCNTPYYLPSHRVPSREQLLQLEAHVRDLQDEKEKRWKEFLSCKAKILTLCTGMGYDPETSFEQDLINESDENFQLTGENMTSLKNVLHELEKKNRQQEQEAQDLWDRVHSLWDRLNLTDAERTDFTSHHKGHTRAVLSALQNEICRCEQLKHSNLKSFIDSTRKEMMDWWNRCYFSKDQRDAFQFYLTDTYTEELLQIHEQELQKLRDYYKAHQEILDQLAKRDKLWKEMLEFEKQASDPNRFFNDRGGKLLREEKARKKLMKELPKVEEDAKEEIEKWEKEHGKAFLVEGMPYEQYIDQLWSQFRKEKEDEKQMRHKNRAKQMEEEMIYGSKPTANTPVKRRLVNTPNRTPLKAMKMNENQKPSPAVSRTQHTPVVPRQPLKVAKKTPNISHTLRRRSVRQARKRLRESMQKAKGNGGGDGKRKAVAKKGNPDAFSQTTVSSSGASCENLSLAAMGSYQDFAKGLSQNSRPNCRSSVMPTAGSSPVKQR